MDYIYLIESYTEFESTYKIGFTKHKNPETRIKQLKTGNHTDLYLINLFPTKHKRKIETSFHRLYSNKKISGEWFRLDEDDVAGFEKRCQILETSFDNINKKN